MDCKTTHLGYAGALRTPDAGCPSGQFTRADGR